MKQELNLNDLEIIQEFSQYTRVKFEEYDKYPSIEYKKQRISKSNSVLEKIIFMKKYLQK